MLLSLGYHRLRRCPTVVLSLMILPGSPGVATSNCDSPATGLSLRTSAVQEPLDKQTPRRGRGREVGVHTPSILPSWWRNLRHDARLQPPKHKKQEIVMVVKHVALRHQLRCHHDRNPNLRSHLRMAPLKHRWRYAHNRVWVLVDFNDMA